ncbi:MAG: hypothetical protein OHK0045_15760 [Raineya sp.]
MFKRLLSLFKKENKKNSSQKAVSDSYFREKKLNHLSPKKEFIQPSVIFYIPATANHTYFDYESFFSTDKLYYVKGSKESLFDRWFESNFDKISQEWQKNKGITKTKSIACLADTSLLRDMDTYLEKSLEYMLPSIDTSQKNIYVSKLKNIFENTSTLELQKLFFEKILGFAFSESSGSGFIRFFFEQERYCFAYTRLDTLESENDIEDFLVQYINDIGRTRTWYQLVPPTPEDEADHSFETYMQQITDEVAEKLRFIYEKGYIGLLIQKVGIDLFKKDEDLQFIETPIMSRIKVTKDYQIYLPEYDNIYLDLAPLEKTLYLFFLKNSKKILLKNLVEYKQELMEIYRKVAYYDDLDKLESNIDRLLDTRENSINEKLSRIKNTVLKLVNPWFAQYYYITGRRGEGKHISLPKNMIVWE